MEIQQFLFVVLVANKCGKYLTVHEQALNQETKGEKHYPIGLEGN